MDDEKVENAFGQSLLATGNIEAWMNKAQWVILRCCASGKLVSAYTDTMLYTPPVPIRASYDPTFNITESTSETWIFEWIDGEYRKCRIRSLTHPTYYWRFIKKYRTFNDQLLLERFPHLDEMGERCLRVNEKIIKPSIFFIAIVESRVCIQHANSQLWISVSDLRNGYFTGSEAFNDHCQFDLGIKVGIWYNNRANLRKYLSLSSSLFGNRITNDYWMVRRRQTFYLYFQGDHLLIFSPAAGKFLGIEQNRLTANASKSTSCKLKLDGGDPWWELYCTTCHQEDVYFRLFLWPDGNIYIAPEIFDKNPMDIERARSVSLFQFILLPENGLELYDNDACLTTSEQLKREKGKVFGVNSDKALANPNSDALIFFEQSTDYILKHVHSEGLFRISGNIVSVKALKQHLNVGTALKNALLLLETENIFLNVDDVCSVFKLFFRNMNPPLIPEDVYIQFIKDSENISSSESAEVFSIPCGNETLQYTLDQFNKYSAIINRVLPKPRRNLLCNLCKFLAEVSSHSDQNKMTPSNLAVVMAPNLVAPNSPSPVFWRFIVTILIVEHEKIFDTFDMPLMKRN